MVHDIDGPRVRWGIVWFVVTVVSAAVSRPLLAGVLALAAGLATDQVLRLRDADVVARSGGRVGGLLSDPRRLPAMIAAGALPLAAAAGGDTLAAALPTVVVVVLVQRLCTSASQPPQANAVAGASMAVAVAAGWAWRPPVRSWHIVSVRKRRWWCW